MKVWNDGWIARSHILQWLVRPIGRLYTVTKINENSERVISESDQLLVLRDAFPTVNVCKRSPLAGTYTGALVHVT